ncbi:uncharacterized protein LOC129607733 isoform X2 [Condylostylus longicornis]|uniref:uncharacterized protein LOC129607733 isoform X2 n=1 Tax=Condylostylus longicornis TaxID=2530218 RepID=UPI00244E1F55|nr:uncharacterized protein LOC129607733 isoform X2 [Condylostylus longicornis]
MEITMTEKDSTRYQYEPYPTLSKTNNSCTNTLKRDDSSAPLKSVSVVSGSQQGVNATRKSRRKCCRCLSSNSTAFWASLLTNLGICTLLFAYTLLGSFIFLAIEGGASQMHQRTLASTINRQLSRPTPSQRTYEDIQSQTGAIEQALNDSRTRAVENIWDITVSLNILYRDNWTKLAALEIEKFQDELIQQFTKHMSVQLQLESGAVNNVGGSNAPSTGAVMILPPRYGLQEYDWTFARAFLYSLTVLTTIGECSI